jgi:hypothetical protein
MPIYSILLGYCKRNEEQMCNFRFSVNYTLSVLITIVVGDVNILSM